MAKMKKHFRSDIGQALKPKHVPQRSCIACRNVSDKRDFVRLVANEGKVEIDLEKKKTGRGAYLCPVYECWEAGLKKNRLEYALRTKLTEENRRMLIEYSESLPKKDAST
jgi:predicted RNA-binding protein YlxR (DUF448 family)